MGNHTNSHQCSDKLPLAAWEEDVARCKLALGKVEKKAKYWFRFPCLQRGKTVERRNSAVGFVEKTGHRVAPVSVDNSDYLLVAPYVEALERGDETSAQEIGQAWVEHILAAVRHYQGVAHDRMDRQVKHILLLHANVLAADYLDTLLSGLKKEGLAFISLDAAMEDEVYSRQDDYAGPIGLSWLYRFKPHAEGLWTWDEEQYKALKERFVDKPKNPDDS